MRVYLGLEQVDLPIERAVLTIGNFDGVHRAHQQILAQAGLHAANTGGPVVVLTFEPHPLNVVAPQKAPPRLSLPEEKLRCLAEAGADIAVVAQSDSTLLGMEADRFVEEVIRRRFHPTHMVEGPSFGFGRGRKGTAGMLKQLAAGFGCEVHIVEPVTLQVEEGETLLVSSSLIRSLIDAGKVRRAALCLGRRYALIGEVVEGERRGRSLGFPTVNLHVREQLVPGEGVYAGGAVVGGVRHPAAISIGAKPTFDGTGSTIEAHLLDYDRDLYGETIRLEFDRHLRPQRKFASAEELAAQLRKDVDATREIHRRKQEGAGEEETSTG